MTSPLADTDSGLAMPRRFWAVLALSTASVLYTLDASITNIALPVIAEALKIKPSTAVMLVAAYNLVLAMTMLPLAAIAERIGHKRVFIAGLAIYVLGSLGSLNAPNFALLVASRAMQGFGVAALVCVSMALVRFVYPTHILGRGLGFNTMCATIGSAIAAPVGGVILTHAPWHAVFGVGLPLAVISIICARALPLTEPHNDGFDTRGAAFCALTFGLIISGLQAMSQIGIGAISLSVTAAGVLSAIIFVRHERATVRPVLPVDLLARPALSLSIASGLLAVLASTLQLLSLPFHLHALGFSTATVAAVLAPYALVVLLVAPTSGMLSDRISPSVLGSIGLSIGLIGLFFMSRISGHPDYLDLIWRLLICALGFSMFFSPNGRLVVGSVPRERAAGASSLLATSRMFGQALAATILAGLLAMAGTGDAATFVCGGLTVFALILSAARIVVNVGQPTA